VPPKFFGECCNSTFMPPCYKENQWRWGAQMRSLGVSSVRHLLPSAFGIIAPLIGVIWLFLR